MISALITLYHPTLETIKNIQQIAEQVDFVYLCDNSPVSNQEIFSNIAPNIYYTSFCENLGISCAFNKILKDPAISWQDNDFIIFFDQDSSVASNHVSKMLAEFSALISAGFSPGCLGPSYFNMTNGQLELPKARTKLLDHTFSVSSIITSSMMCTYGTLKEIGFWNEHVFLDMADWDLCWRIVAAGKQCCLTNIVVLQHSLGVGEKRIGLLRLRVGHPYREYYQIRECLYLLKQRYTPIKYQIRFLAMILIRTPLHLMFLDHRRERLKYIAHGFWDFFRGRTGSLDSQHHKTT